MGRRSDFTLRWTAGEDMPICDKVLLAFRDELIAECLKNVHGVKLPMDLGMYKVVGLHFHPKRVMGATHGGVLNLNTNGLVFTLKWFSKVPSEKVDRPYQESFRESAWYCYYNNSKAKKAVSAMVKKGDWKRFHVKDDRGLFTRPEHDYLKIGKKRWAPNRISSYKRIKKINPL
jgi:hypothetical protein